MADGDGDGNLGGGRHLVNTYGLKASCGRLECSLAAVAGPIVR